MLRQVHLNCSPDGVSIVLYANDLLGTRVQVDENISSSSDYVNVSPVLRCVSALMQSGK